MRKAHFDLEQRAIQAFGEMAVSQGSKLQDAADLINELLAAFQEKNEYIDKLIAKGRTLAEFNEALRALNTELTNENKKLSVS